MESSDLLAELGREIPRLRKEARAVMITGPIGSGKTRLVQSLAETLRAEGLPVEGIASPRILKEEETVGYKVVDLVTAEERVLCQDHPPGVPFRRFYFQPEALDFANRLLEKAAQEAEVIVVDEVGPLELEGGGFAPGLAAAIRSQALLILTVRPFLVDAVRSLLSAEVTVFPLK